MSKSGGGGGFKGGDKASKGSCKVIERKQGLETALDQVPDAILCPAGHRMKLHGGNRREGNLTCDGPEERCCGRDGDGILFVGDERYSCVECDFDICPGCVDYETKEPLTPEQQREELRKKLREKTGRGGGGGGGGGGAAADAPSAEAQVAAAKAAMEAKRAEIEAKVAAAKAAMAAKEGAEEETRQQGATDAAKAAKKKAKKAAQKQRKKQAAKAGAQAEGDDDDDDDDDDEDEVEKPASPPAAKTIVVSFGAAAMAAPATPPAAIAPAAAAAAPFAFNWGLSTPTAGGGGGVDSDESDDEEEEEADEVPPPSREAAIEAALAKAADAKAATTPLTKPEHPLVCPFTKQVMSDPVILADGYTYERKVVETYLSHSDVSPRTGERLAHKSVLPNLMALELCKLALNFD